MEGEEEAEVTPTRLLQTGTRNKPLGKRAMITSNTHTPTHPYLYESRNAFYCILGDGLKVGGVRGGGRGVVCLLHVCRHCKGARGGGAPALAARGNQGQLMAPPKAMFEELKRAAAQERAVRDDGNTIT